MSGLARHLVVGPGELWPWRRGGGGPSGCGGGAPSGGPAASPDGALGWRLRVDAADPITHAAALRRHEV